MNPSGPGLFLGGRLLIDASTSALVIGLFTFSTSSWFRKEGLGGCKCPGIYPFIPGLLVYVYIVVCSSL